MRSERLARFLEDAVAFDCETHKIQPGLLVPPLVCAAIARWSPARGRSEGALLDRDAACWAFLILLREARYIIVGANIAYDMAVMAHELAQRGLDVMPLVHAAYDEGRVFDVQIAEALHAVALGMLGKDPRTGAPLQDPETKKRGRYSLAIVLYLVLGRRDAKANDRFRQSYALLEGVPIAEWPSEARVYPIDDACNTLDVALAQAGLVPRPAEHVWPDDAAGESCTVCGTVIGFGEIPPCPPRRSPSLNLHDVARQSYAALAMHLGAAWGFMVDPAAVDELEARVRASREEGLARFLQLGFLRWKKEKGVSRAAKHTAVIKRANALAYGAKGACGACAGTQKVSSAKTGNPVGCRACDSTGLNLDSAPVPRTKGSKCRTCSGARSFAVKKTGQVVACKQCEGQPDIIPGCGTSRDALSESGLEDLIDFAGHLEEAKILETYIPFLRKGLSEVPDEDEDGDDE